MAATTKLTMTVAAILPGDSDRLEKKPTEAAAGLPVSIDAWFVVAVTGDAVITT